MRCMSAKPCQNVVVKRRSPRAGWVAPSLVTVDGSAILGPMRSDDVDPPARPPVLRPRPRPRRGPRRARRPSRRDRMPRPSAACMRRSSTSSTSSGPGASAWTATIRPTFDEAVEELTVDDLPTIDALAARWARTRRRCATGSPAWATPAWPGSCRAEDPPRHPMWFHIAHLYSHAIQQFADAATLLTPAGQSPGELDFLDFVEVRLDGRRRRRVVAAERRRSGCRPPAGRWPPAARRPGSAASRATSPRRATLATAPIPGQPGQRARTSTARPGRRPARRSRPRSRWRRAAAPGSRRRRRGRSAPRR